MKLDLGEPVRPLYRGRQMFSAAFADCIRWWHPRFPITGIEPLLREKLRADPVKLDLGEPAHLWQGFSSNLSVRLLEANGSSVREMRKSEEWRRTGRLMTTLAGAL